MLNFGYFDRLGGWPRGGRRGGAIRPERERAGPVGRDKREGAGEAGSVGGAEGEGAGRREIKSGGRVWPGG